MALIEELNRQGNQLFKYRSSLPVPFAVLGLALYLYHIHYLGKEAHSLGFELFCLGVGLLGQLIRGITLAYTPKGTSGRNTHGQVADELNTKGMYSMMRNPLYLGNFFMWFAVVLFVDVHWFSLLYVMCFWMYYERIIFAEENFLRQKYGAPYLEWTQRTPIFLPKLGAWERPDLACSFRNVLKREYSGFFALFFSFALFDFCENFVRYETFELSLFWMYALIGSGVVTFILRTLKKKTRLLHVRGR